jgi:glycogen operon protein
VSFNEKHNEANLEGNQDGENHNTSWNHGVEGPTDDPDIRARREQQKRNLLATLFLSQGVPMMLAGDEMGRSQGGNNNAYCQDNEISWVHWELTAEQRDLVKFVTFMIKVLKDQPVLRRRRFLRGHPLPGRQTKDVTWFDPGGQEMSDAAWASSAARGLGILLSGTEIGETDERGDPVSGATLFLMFNTDDRTTVFALPPHRAAERWERVLDTAATHWSLRSVLTEATYPASGRSVVVCRLGPWADAGDTA